MSSIFEMDKQFVAGTYGRQPIAIVEGKGVEVKDSEGKKYVDFIGGIAVCALGHCHPAVTKAIAKQAKKLVHISNLYYIEPQAELAKALAEVTPPSISKFFFCNSGAEAVEAALKLAFKHTEKKRVVSFEEAFHGRTTASIGASWKKTYREPFGPLIPDIYDFAPYNNLAEAEKVINEDTAAVIVEVVQGEGGVRVSDPEFIHGLRKLCDEKGAVLIFDEIQTGMGRTGKWFASEHVGVEPDIMTMAKALGNGFPIGCMGAKPEIMDSFQPGNHASTFGGNPLACAVSLAVIETLKKERLPDRAAEIGEYFKKKLNELKDRSDMVKEVRGLGLMIGIELNNAEVAKAAVGKAREAGYLINCTADTVLRFVPPLVIEKKHIDGLVKVLEKILEER